MFSNWLLVTVSISYIGLLFLLAHFGGKYFQRLTSIQHSLIYALSLGVYCTSWGFLGTAAQAANSSFTYFSVYLAPIILFTFCWPFIQRIISVCIKLNITSIADLLSARFGKSQLLAVVITIVALIGTMPYIALQLKAIVYSYKILQQNQDFPIWLIGLIVSMILAGFTILFGVRSIDISERHPGVMIAIAFESIVKLVAFIIIGLFVSYFVYESPSEIFSLSTKNIKLDEQFNIPNLFNMLGLLIIVISAFLCLPRQFQVMFVEIKQLKHAFLSRWLISVYVFIFAIFAAPIGLAGFLHYADTMPADAYALFLPASNGQLWLSLFSFIGAISAASSMVIVSTIALSTMLSNEIVFPVMFKYIGKQKLGFNQFQAQLLMIRKLLVLFVILSSFCLLLLSPPDTLSSLGEIAFGAIAQIGPALVAAFFWRRSTLNGVLSGIISGFTLWFILNFLPQLGVYEHTLKDASFSGTTAITLLGLVTNILILYIVSVTTRQSLREQVQSKYFYPQKDLNQWHLAKQTKVDLHELELLVARFIGAEKAERSFARFIQDNKDLKAKAYDEAVISHTETTLATVLGSASAKLVTSFTLSSEEMAFDQVAQLVEESSYQRLEFSRSVLQSAIENANEGISVIDGELKLVAWNQQYLDIFKFPDELIFIGAPISKLIYFNLSQRPEYATTIDHQVQKRLDFIKEGSRHSSERKLDNGITIHIEGNPIPGGGFVMIFSDITRYRQTEKHLKEEKDDLESRVLKRTVELEKANRELAQANNELAQARYKAEQAHLKKSQYLKACSHDLLQPLSAARLFSSAISLSPKVSDIERQQIRKIDDSLEIANNLLLDLNEIAQIESGNIQPDIKVISIKELFAVLENEFTPLINEYGVDFRTISSNVFIKSDMTLLTRIIQNYLMNAFRYSNKGSVLLGGRRSGKNLIIQVHDTGPGILKEKQQEIFEQFVQLPTNTIASQGLGLGLNIAKSLAAILNHDINLHSSVGKGSVFSVCVPMEKRQVELQVIPKTKASLEGVKVLCIDNEEAIIDGMKSLLNKWQCNVYTADNIQKAISLFHKHQCEFDFLLVDFQLSHNLKPLIIDGIEIADGIDLIHYLKSKSAYSIPAILITATTDENVKFRAKAAGIGYLRKIIKPIALRALMSSLLAKNLADNYSKTR